MIWDRYDSIFDSYIQFSICFSIDSIFDSYIRFSICFSIDSIFDIIFGK